MKVGFGARSEKYGPSGRSYWQNPEFDKVFADSRAELDEKKREQMLFQLGQMMHDQLPSLYLFQLPALYGVSNKLDNWKPRPDEMLDVVRATVK